MQEKILFVDDEPAVLQGYQRLFRSDFRIDTAVGGKGALIAIKAHGPYAVVVSDMRMPEMDGVQFLREVKKISADTIRIVLSGQADLAAAIDAVNEGSIFRFLMKPCDKESLGKTLAASLQQYHLVITEKDLLEKTLKASVQVFAEVLSVVNPAAFSQAMRLRRYMSHIVTALGLARPWRFEVAAMLSQLGCVTLDPETVAAVYAGRDLPADEQARYNLHPMVARGLLENIPRMEAIAWMIAHQNETAPMADLTDREMADMRRGAGILHATLAFDQLLRQGKSRTEAAHRVARQHKGLDPKIFHALVKLEPETEETEVRACALAELSAGMILEQDICADNGLLLAAKGQEVSSTLILKLESFRDKGAIHGAIKVTVPKRPQAAASPQGSGKA